MKKQIIGAAVALALGSVSMGAMAQGSGFGIGVKAGTLGVGVELTKSINEHFNARLGFNQYKYTTSTTRSNIEYDADADWKNGGLFLDWHPMAGSFRLTVGYMVNNNEVKLTGKPTAGSYDINGTTYPSSLLTSVTGKVTFDNGAFAGLGWGNAGDGDGLGFSFELGALYQGSPSLSLYAQGNSTLINDPTFKSNLEAERKSAEDSMSGYKWYPVASLGITYAF